MTRLVSSLVRTEIRHATRISNGDLWPASYSSNSIAFGNGRTASRMRSIATSMSNGRLFEATTDPALSAVRSSDGRFLLNRAQAFLVDAADNAFDIRFFDRQIVDRVARSHLGDQLSSRRFNAIELEPASRTVGADLPGIA